MNSFVSIPDFNETWFVNSGRPEVVSRQVDLVAYSFGRPTEFLCFRTFFSLDEKK